jgi:hypothetical protein
MAIAHRFRRAAGLDGDGAAETLALVDGGGHRILLAIAGASLSAPARRRQFGK